MSRMDFKTICKEEYVGYKVYQYENGYKEHEKNMLTNMMGVDFNLIEDVFYNEEEIKNNLELCGIII